MRNVKHAKRANTFFVLLKVNRKEMELSEAGAAATVLTDDSEIERDSAWILHWSALSENIIFTLKRVEKILIGEKGAIKHHLASLKWLGFLSVKTHTVVQCSSRMYSTLRDCEDWVNVFPLI